MTIQQKLQKIRELVDEIEGDLNIIPKGSRNEVFNAPGFDAPLTTTNDLIDKFKAVNPSYERLFANKNQRLALERMVKKYGYEKVGRTIDVACETYGKEFAPTITTPVQLERDLGKLIAYTKKQTPAQKKGERPKDTLKTLKERYPDG